MVQYSGVYVTSGVAPLSEYHWECLTATDFLSVEVYTIKGLATYYVLFFIDIASRSIQIAGITPHPSV